MSVVGALQLVEDDVRELARRRGMDLAQDVGSVREVIAEYGERSLDGLLPVLDDPEGLERAVLDAVAGPGPLQRTPRRPGGRGVEG